MERKCIPEALQFGFGATIGSERNGNSRFDKNEFIQL
jgi:hypothetical protein